MADHRHRVQVDHSERDARLLELLRQSGDFDLRMARLVGVKTVNSSRKQAAAVSAA